MDKIVIAVFDGIEITLREVLVSIIIVLFMAAAGFMISEKISSKLDEENEEYEQAVKIENDRELFEYLEENIERVFDIDRDVCEYISEHNCRVKYNVVMKDERESGLREILNLGHTVGRAVETVSDYRLTHGEAVAIGLIAQARLGEKLCRDIYSGPLALTQSRIDSYTACPLAYFCKFTVGLREEEKAEFDASGIGTFIHAILENFFSALIKDGIHPSELTEEEKTKLTRRAAEKYLAELGNEMDFASPKTKIKLGNLCRAALPVVDGLCEEFSSSLFEPRFFELSINKKDPDSPEPIVFKPEGEGEVFVYGIIDRVDTYKSGKDVYVRVVDYKTGQKTFSPSDIEEGKNLQMFLYLKAILESEKKSFRESLGVEEGGRAIPAGVIYIKTSVKDVRVDSPSDAEALVAFKEAQGREGMVLDSEEVLSAMGIRYTPLSTAKKPDVIAESRRKLMFDEPKFEQLMESVEEAVLDVAESIRSGKIDARPKADSKGLVHCDYCEFKPICRIAKIKK